MRHNNNIILLNTINTYSLRISHVRFQNQILLFYIITYVLVVFTQSFVSVILNSKLFCRFLTGVFVREYY